MKVHYMTKASGGIFSACGKTSYQIGLSTMFTNIPSAACGCKKCVEAAKKGA